MDLFSLLAEPVKIDKKIRLITLFSGYGSQEMAMRNIGADFEIWKAVEFDKYAVKSYNAVHGTDIETTDIRDVKGPDLNIVDKDEYSYVMFYSFPCFTGDTLVLTQSGLKQIKNVVAGDFVLTHTNKYEKVLASKKTGKKTIFKIKGMGIDEICCTENHKFYTRKMTHHFPCCENGKRKRQRVFDTPIWTECKDLTKNHYLGVAINQNSIIPEWQGIKFEWADGRKPRHKNELSKLMNNHSFWWVIGRYLGDGWVRSQGGIIICCEKSETTEILPHLRNCGFNHSISEERTVNKIHIALKELQSFVELFGHGAGNKHIPGFVFDMPKNYLKSLIEGYVSADGYVKNGLFKLTSISRELVYGMAQLVAKAYETPYRIYKTNRKPTCVIEGRLCNQKPSYDLVFKTEKKKQDKAFYENGYIWFPIQSIKNTNSSEDVFDIEVQNNHSFMANGVIAHNCTDLSCAGKMLGMKKGGGTRSGLLWEVERILSELDDGHLPDILVMENVPQVHSRKNEGDFNDWLSYLESRGYQNFWKDLNAKDFGVPQNRVRCFCVSILSKEQALYEFPNPIPLDKRLKDLLEDDVDEKYYITNPKAEGLLKELVESGKLDGGGRETVRMKNMASANESYVPSAKISDVSAPCLARDYKGPANQAECNGVLECLR